MPQNQYLPIATGTGANALTFAQWLAQGTLLAQGFQSGVVPSNQFNTFLRQLSVPVSAIAQFTADNQTLDVLDDGVVANFEAKFKAALQNVAMALISSTAPVSLQANKTLYVRTDGNDSTGDGSANTSTKAFATIAGALAYAVARYNFAGFSLIVQLGIPGTYAAPYSISGIPNLTVIGASGNQAAYILTGSASGFLFNPSGINCTLIGVTVNLTGTGCGGVSVSNGSLSMSYTSFTSSGQTCTNSLLSAGVAGILTIGNGCIINGCNPTAFFSVANGGGITQTAAVTLQGSLTASAFITATNCGIYQTGTAQQYINQTTYNNITIRFNVSNNAVVSTNGGGQTYFLGSGTGQTSAGGQYV